MALIKITGDIVESNTITGNTIATGTITTNNISGSVNLGGPKISSITYPGDDTAVDTAGGQTVVLTGNGFNVGASVLLDGVAVGTVTVTNSTSISFTSPAKSAGGYIIYVVNTDGSTAVSVPGLQYSGVPSWVTAAGQLANVYETAAVSNTVSATGDGSVSYSLYSGTLPPGATLAANGQLSGTSESTSSPTTYTFTIRATDAQNQDTDRTFTVTINPDVVTWSAPANNSTITTYEYSAISNTFVATSAAGKSITYSANVLPANVTISGATVSGTPTTVGNTTSLITATAATTGRTSTETINFVVQQDVVTWSSPANNVTYTWEQGVANTANLAATSAAGKAITFTANSLPAGLSVSGNTIAGTPTTAGNSSSLITATAATTNRTAVQTINWVINVASDAYWKTTTLLISAGSNTAPNTFIQDASLNNAQLAIAGGAAPNNFNPYTLGFYSNYFDGSGDYLTVPHNTNLNLPSGTPFTIEGWMHPVRNYTGSQNGFRNIISKRASGGLASNYQLALYYNDNRMFFFNGSTVYLSTSQVALNTWTHFAYVYDGASTAKLYLNGTLDVTHSVSIGATNSADVWIGSLLDDTSTYDNFGGYLSNIRIVKGTQVYTSNFTPSTSPLTAITDTQLLTCQSNRLIDSSTNAFTVTKNGDTAVSGAHPFTPNTSYSNYGSTYFDGDGDYLMIPGNQAMGTNSFTIECWVYISASASSWRQIFSTRASSSTASTTAGSLAISNSGYLSWFTNTTIATSSAAFPIGAWTHVALVRNGTALAIYQNGVSVATATNSDDLTVATMSVGAHYDGTEPFTGHISDLRVVKGTALYTSTFTPPTTLLTAVANTQLLTCQYNNGATNNGFVDKSAFNNTINRAGSVSQGTFSPYSVTGWSYYFDGTGDYISSTVPAIGTGNFTFECWVYRTAQINNDSIINIGGASELYIQLYQSSIVRAFIGGQQVTLDDPSPPNDYLNRWFHIAVTRTSGTVRLFVDGVLKASGNYNTNLTATTAYIGSMDSTDGYWQGYLSNLRLIVGTSLYTSTFTPSTTPLAAVANTKLLTCQSNRIIDNSPNQYTLTKGGDVSVRAFSPFSGTAVAPTSYSFAFDGTDDKLTFPSSSSFNLGTTYTVEGWMYVKALHGSEWTRFIMISSNGDTAGWELAVGPSGVLDCGSPSPLGGIVSQNIVSGSVVPLNTWVHFAVSRDATSARLYANGVLLGSNANPATQTAGNVPLILGYDTVGSVAGQLNGFLSNVRIVKGTALYTTAFTPPTAPLSAVSNTVLLTCQSAQIIDNSTNGFAITINNDVKPSTFNPFGLTTESALAYTANVNGGSAYYDGSSGNYLTIPSSSKASTIQPGDFTWETWFYPTTSSSNFQQLYGTWNNSSSQWAFGYTHTGNFSRSARIYIYRGNYGSNEQARFSTTQLPLNQWSHIAWVRRSDVIYLYVNGIPQTLDTYQAGFTWSETFTETTGQTCGIGGTSNYSLTAGYLADMRYVQGTAMYKSVFVPPTSPLPVTKDTVLAFSPTNGGIIDAHSTNVLQTAGDTRLAPESPYEGNYYSAYFDGTGDRITVPGDMAYAFGTGNFTIELWVYPTAFGTYLPYVSQFFSLTQGVGSWFLASNSSGGHEFYYDGQPYITFSGRTVTLGKWQHIALVRSGTTVTLYIDGQSAGTGTVSNSVGTNSSVLEIGGSAFNTSFGGSGYISNVRILKGTALYTTTFTPPTAPLTAIANTSALLCQSNKFIDNSTTAATVTVVGDSKVKSLNPFQRNSGTSVYFDGTNDLLIIPNNPALNVSAGDYTVEGWFYTTDASAIQTLIWLGGNTNAYAAIRLGISSGAINFYVADGSGSWGINSGGIGTVVSGQWYHIAVCRSSTYYKVFLNGTQIGSTYALTAGPVAYGTGTLNYIGALNNAGGGSAIYRTMYGYMKDVRVTKGYARYTTTFTPPTEPLKLK